jgi:hypothetical protein
MPSTPAFSDLSPLMRSLFLAARAAEAAKKKAANGLSTMPVSYVSHSIAATPARKHAAAAAADSTK